MHMLHVSVSITCMDLILFLQLRPNRHRKDIYYGGRAEWSWLFVMGYGVYIIIHVVSLCCIIFMCILLHFPGPPGWCDSSLTASTL